LGEARIQQMTDTLSAMIERQFTAKLDERLYKDDFNPNLDKLNKKTYSFKEKATRSSSASTTRWMTDKP